tara:strand:- start:281 stop:1246 length:966 start_codon:yes stop_codon:yes gene_type:complete
MADQDDESNNRPSSLVEGGLPQLLAGPAGKAISRLVGAGIEIPAAWLEGISQGIRDKTDARSAISKALAVRASELALGNPETVERAMQSMVAKAYRAQINKEEIAKLAVDDLKETPASVASAGPSEQWMAKFEGFAADAVDTDLRTMFSRLLSGEIRDPGSISPATLQFVSLLDAEIALLIEKTLPACGADGRVFLDAIRPSFSIEENTALETGGFWSLGKSISLQIGDDGKILSIIGNDEGYMVEGEPGTTENVNVGLLSLPGRNLVRTIKKSFDRRTFAESLMKNEKIEKVSFGRLVLLPEDKGHLQPEEFYDRASVCR